MEIHNKIREHWVDSDYDLTAKKVLADPEVAANWEAWLFPLVRWECRRLARADVRTIENGGGDQPRVFTQDSATSAPADRCPLLDQRFCFGLEGDIQGRPAPGDQGAPDIRTGHVPGGHCRAGIQDGIAPGDGP